MQEAGREAYRDRKECVSCQQCHHCLISERPYRVDCTVRNVCTAHPARRGQGSPDSARPDRPHVILIMREVGKSNLGDS